MRTNDLTDFNMYEQSLTQNVKQPNGAYSEQATPPPNLTTKDITENGEYFAAEDNADGYSSVNVEVENHIQYIVYSYNYALHGLFWSANGEYKLSTTGISEHLSGGVVLCDPAVAIEINNSIASSYTFTPGESFVVTNNGTPVTLSGDTVTPNDGKMYELHIGGGPDGKPQYTITNTDRDFVITIK